MASPLSKFLSPVADAYAPSFGTGYTPFAAIGNNQYDQTAQAAAPVGSVWQGQEWNPAGQSVSNQVNRWQQQQLAEQQAKMQAQGGGMLGGSGPMTSLGGDWSGVDQWNAQINAAANQYGVPANLIKSIMKLESGGANLGMNGAGAVGPMQVVQSIWGGLGYDLNDPAQNIMAGAAILKQMYDSYSGWATQNGVDPWKAAAISYYAGNPYNLSAADDPAQGGSGISAGGYGDQVWNDYQTLNTGAGVTTRPWSTNGSANSAINAAMQYVGVPYVWGGIPGKGDNPWDTGWDCSGFTYWLDQNYGGGQLPMGSHYQYQYAQQTGQLFMDTNQLQPGDLVFFNTGWQGGAGSELNGAGHVAMYIGNGKMIHAANPSQGTIISDFTNYAPSNGYQYLGAMHMGFSGGAPGVPGQTQTPSYGSQPGYWNQFFSHFS